MTQTERVLAQLREVLEASRFINGGAVVKISEIIWRAANERLAEDDWSTKTEYSCWAVREVYEAAEYERDYALGFLHSLGVDATRGDEFREFRCGEHRQGARYLWLMFAYEVAKSEGL